MKPERKEELRRAIALLIDEVNGGSPAELAEVMFEQLTRSHRTLQQSFLGTVKLTLYKYGSLEEHWTDLRNEFAWKWAKEVSKIPNSDVRFPLI